MGTITRSHTFTAGEKPTDTQWNVDINQLFTLVNGNIDNAIELIKIAKKHQIKVIATKLVDCGSGGNWA